jgi:predicted nucleic acid-binding protein
MRSRIEPVFTRDVERAASLADEHAEFEARDLVHVAVMERVGATAIVTADTTFDGLKGIERLDPLKANRWLKRFEDTSA